MSTLNTAPNSPNSPLSMEERMELERIMNIKYASKLMGRLFTITSHHDTAASFVKVTLLKNDESFYYPIEGRIEHKSQNLSAKEASLLLIDYIDSYFDEFLREDENVFVPIDWSEFSYEGFTLSLRGQIQDLKSESIADQILAEGKVLPKADTLQS
ncbi:MAG: hypothetical protein HRU09_08510 [Oligoflexales bacterium]|nr:hypothetical protein [Oligoflexales bacterium]